MAKRRFQKRDGKWALTAERDGDGYFHLIRFPGTANEYDAGLVAHAENFGTAIDEAEEEMRVLVAQAREEFGF